MAGRRASSGSVLFIWVGTILIDLLAVLALAHDAEEDALLFGRAGTTTVLVLLAVIAVVDAACAWRGVTGSGRTVAAGASFVAAALAIVVMFGFFGGDSTKASSVTPLLLYCAFAEAMIGAAVLRSARPTRSPTRGR